MYVIGEKNYGSLVSRKQPGTEVDGRLYHTPAIGFDEREKVEKALYLCRTAGFCTTGFYDVNFESKNCSIGAENAVPTCV
jgi:hypothetical protein